MKPQAEEAIVVDRVSKTYPGRGLLDFFRPPAGGNCALQDISLTVAEGETVGLLGPNGAGKTTLLKIIASLLYPTSGRVLVQGIDLVKDALRARAQLGLVTCDDRSFYFRLTGRQNLAFFATLYGIPAGKARDRVEELLGMLGLLHAADRPFHSYSSGMKQKLAIARGLLGDPGIVLYDEPTRSLDPLSAQNLRKWVVANRETSPRTAHLIATNQLNEAEQLCDRVLIINRGVIIAQGTIDEIRWRFRENQQVVHHLSCRDLPPQALPLPDPERGLLSVSEEQPEGDLTSLRVCSLEGSDGLSLVLAAILRAGASVVHCQAEEIPFDEVFCGLLLQEQQHASVAQGGRR